MSLYIGRAYESRDEAGLGKEVVVTHLTRGECLVFGIAQ